MSSTSTDNTAALPAERQRSPLGELLALAIPTVAQMASYTLLQFADTWMLSTLGAAEPTAAANAGIFAFAMMSLGFGTLMIVNTLVSQHFGARDYAHCGRYLWQGVWFSVIYALVTLPLLFIPGWLFTALGHPGDLIDLEASYFRITMFAMVLKLVSTTLGQFLLAVNRPGKVLMAAATAVLFNLFGNWVLIWGHLGLPAMGLAGAAWATNAAVLLEVAILVWFTSRPQLTDTFGLREWRLIPSHFATLVRVGLPSGAQVVADVLAWGMFIGGVMAVFGESGMAANSFMFRYMSVSFMPAFGLSCAVTALVGRYIGAHDFATAEQRTHLGFAVAVSYMMACGLIFLVARYPLIGLFTDDPEILRIGATLMIFAAVFQLFDAMYIVYNGGLRGAGDTFVPAVATAGLCWGLIVFGGYVISRAFPQFGPAGPWIIATIYGVILGLFVLVRFRRGGWRSIHLEDEEPQGFNPNRTSDTVAGLQLSAEQ